MNWAGKSNEKGSECSDMKLFYCVMLIWWIVRWNFLCQLTLMLLVLHKFSSNFKDSDKSPRKAIFTWYELLEMSFWLCSALLETQSLRNLQHCRHFPTIQRHKLDSKQNWDIFSKSVVEFKNVCLTDSVKISLWLPKCPFV